MAKLPISRRQPLDILNGEAVSGEYAGRSFVRADYSVDKIFPYFGLNSFPNYMGIRLAAFLIPTGMYQSQNADMA